MVPRTVRRLVIAVMGAFASLIGLAVCAAVIVFTPLTGITRSGAAARAQVTPDVRLITFNFDGSNREHERVSRWVREREPDLLLVQEIYPFVYDHQAVPGLLDMLPYTIQQQTRLGYRGVSLMSRYPIRETITYDYDGPFARAVVSLPIGDVVVYNVSLANPVSRSTGAAIGSPLDLLGGYDTRARDSQIRQMLTLLETETLPVIVAGDHNLMEIEPAYGWLSARMTDVFAAVGEGSGATWDAQRQLLLRIDYVWADAGWCPLTAALGPELGSDHLPVEAALMRGQCP